MGSSVEKERFLTSFIESSKKYTKQTFVQIKVCLYVHNIPSNSLVPEFVASDVLQLINNLFDILATEEGDF